MITAKENPMVFYFSRIFLSVFHGDTKALQEQFDLDFSVKDEQWTLKLTPRNHPLDSVFESITLEGLDTIERLTLLEVRGDKTEIQFANQAHQPKS